MQLIKVNVYDTKKNQKSNLSVVVASTKSRNNLFADLEAKDIIPFTNTADTKEFYLDRGLAKQHAEEMADSFSFLSDTEKASLTSAIVNMLEIGCLVKRLDK